MSNSDDSQADGREKIYSVIWGALIFAAVVWWFYPQIREQIQPNRSPTEIVVPNEVVEEPEQEKPSEAVVNTETLTVIQTDTDIVSTAEPEPLTVIQTDTDIVDTAEPEPLTVIQTDTDIVDTAEPEPQQVSAPEFDGTRLDADGSLVVYGLAEGFGYVVLSLDGREFPEARADLNGNGKFAILAQLPRKTEPQALQLWLFPEDGGGPIISEGVTFVTLPPETIVSDTTDASNSVGDKTTLKADESETGQVSLAPEVIIADESGVRVIQDGTGTSTIATVSIDTISYDLDGQVSIGGRAAGTGFVRIYIDNSLIATSKITSGGYWKADFLNIKAGIYKLRADEISETGEVLSRVEIPFKREKPDELVALTTESSTEGGEKIKINSAITQNKVKVQDQVVGLEASTLTLELNEVVSNVIGIDEKVQPIFGRLKVPNLSIEFRIKTVQPGSTLWAIAKERYGSGIEYHKVFEANKERIKDPDLIYPGQVFEIPD
jgi:LysM repeat protein